MVAVPVLTPVTSPVVDTEAMLVADELHAQPVVDELTVAAPPAHIFVNPDIGAGVAPTVNEVVA